MLDINLIREKPEYVKEALKKKLWDTDFTELLEWDKQKRELLKTLFQLSKPEYIIWFFRGFQRKKLPPSTVKIGMKKKETKNTISKATTLFLSIFSLLLFSGLFVCFCTVMLNHP